MTITSSKRHVSLIVALVMILSLFSLTACNSGTSAGDKVIKIGVVGPETGGSAQLGQGQRNAAQLAVDEINANQLAGGWKLEIYFEDDEGNPTKSSSATNKLIQEKNVDIVIAAINSSATLADMVVTERAGIVQMTAGSTGASITEQGSEWIFRTAANDSLQADALVKYAKEDLGLTEIATLTAADDYGQSGAKLLKSAAEKYGVNVVSEQIYNNGDKDLKPQLMTINDSGAQCVFMWGLYTEAALIANQSRQLGMDVQLFGASGMASQKLIELSGEAGQGLILTQTFLPDADIEAIKTFVEHYKAKYNEEPIPHGAQAYDTVYIIAEAVKQADTTDSEKLRDAIRGISGLELVTGAPSFTQTGDDVGKRLLITEIQDDKFVLVTEIVAR